MKLHRFFIFTPIWGREDFQLDEHIFQRGWNHQPENFGICTNIVYFFSVFFVVGGDPYQVVLESQLLKLTSFKKDCKLWVISLPSNSHHQDYNIFSRGSRPTFAIIAGKVGQPNWDTEMTETYICPVMSNEIKLVSCFILGIILFS